MGELVEDELKEERRKFEDLIYYRAFCERYKNGAYKLEWVDSLWRGWLMKLGSDQA